MKFYLKRKKLIINYIKNMDTTPFWAEIDFMSLSQLQGLKQELHTLALEQRNSCYYEQTLSVITYVEKRIIEVMEEKQIL